MADDSPLSIAANVIGILTFVVAVAAGLYARAMSLKTTLRHRNDIRMATIDTLEAFEETKALDQSSQKFKNNDVEELYPSDLTLVEIYVDTFELMRLFFVLARDENISAVRSWTQSRTKWESRLKDVKSRIAKAQQAHLLARLHANLQSTLRSEIHRISAQVDDLRAHTFNLQTECGILGYVYKSLVS